MSREKGMRSISFINWFITLIFSIIPGVNLLFFILTIAGARTASKRSFAAAALVLSLILLVGACVVVIFFGEAFVDWAEALLSEAEMTV